MYQSKFRLFLRDQRNIAPKEQVRGLYNFNSLLNNRSYFQKASSAFTQDLSRKIANYLIFLILLVTFVQYFDFELNYQVQQEVKQFKGILISYYIEG